MPPIATVVEIAIGHDNESGCLPLSDLSTGLFTDYYFGIKTTWIEGETVHDGNRRLKKVAKDSAEWHFYWLTREELEYLLTDIMADELDAEVTIKTLNKATNTWGYYNAIMTRPDLTALDELGVWTDIVVVFIDLTPL